MNIVTRESTVVIGERTYRIREVTEEEATLHEMLFGWYLMDSDGRPWVPVDSRSDGRWILHAPNLPPSRRPWLERTQSPAPPARHTALGTSVAWKAGP